MKIVVTVERRTFTTYDVEVPDDFDVKSEDAASFLANDWFAGGGFNWEECDEDIANWDIDYIGEIK